MPEGIITFTTTGRLALRLGKSREAAIDDLRKAGIEPVRDATGRRLLTEEDVQKVLALQQRRRKRGAGR